jgi:hypothetical protein
MVKGKRNEQVPRGKWCSGGGLHEAVQTGGKTGGKTGSRRGGKDGVVRVARESKANLGT